MVSVSQTSGRLYTQPCKEHVCLTSSFGHNPNCNKSLCFVWCAGGQGQKVLWESLICPSHCSLLFILAGFGADFMSNHAFGRGTVAGSVLWIDTLVPQARFILQAVRVCNRMRIGSLILVVNILLSSVLYLVRQQLYMFARVCARWLILSVRLPCSFHDVIGLQQEFSHDIMCTSVLGQHNFDHIQKPMLWMSLHGIACWWHITKQCVSRGVFFLF